LKQKENTNFNKVDYISMDEELLSAKTNHRRGESMPTVSNDT